MKFWIRELLGWGLLLIGLFVFYLCVLLLLHDPPRVFAAGSMSVIGIFIFRGGIHLLKVAIAARICLQLESKK